MFVRAYIYPLGTGANCKFRIITINHYLQNGIVFNKFQMYMSSQVTHAC